MTLFHSIAADAGLRHHGLCIISLYIHSTRLSFSLSKTRKFSLTLFTQSDESFSLNNRKFPFLINSAFHPQTKTGKSLRYFLLSLARLRHRLFYFYSVSSCCRFLGGRMSENWTSSIPKNNNDALLNKNDDDWKWKKRRRASSSEFI